MSYDITSPGNERIKWLAGLRDRKSRDAEGVFVVEGERLYRRAVDSGLSPVVTFVSSDDLATTGETVSVDPSVLDKASYRKRSEGIIGVFPRFETALDRVELSPEPLLLVVESIEKPGNLGAMMRTGAAAGVDAVVTVEGTVDPFNPNAIRASTGALFEVPVAVSSWDEVGPWLTGNGIDLVAASPDGDVALWDADLTGPLAVVIGAEDAGLSGQAKELARELVVIPQAGDTVDSLNASVAAALFLYEVVRQRSG